MKVIVDRYRCEANALCVASVPEVFSLDDDDVLHVLDENPPEALRERLEEAVLRCPRQAIQLAE